MHASKRALLVAACGLAAGVLPLAAMAQGNAWPTKPIRLVVGFPGGSTGLKRDLSCADGSLSDCPRQTL
jgi:tripartite-type tricarboxylate transporter receptor subunit TctC